MKRTFGLFLIALLFFCTNPTYALGSVVENNDNLLILSIDEKTTLEDFTEADVLVVSYEDLELISNIAKDLVDANKTLYITAPKSSAEDIALILGIPKEGVSNYNNELLVAYSIFKVDSLYIFQNHYVAFGKTLDTNSPASKDDIFQSSNVINNEIKEKHIPYPSNSNFDIVKISDETTIEKLDMINHGIDATIATKQTSFEDLESIIHSSIDDSIITPFSSSGFGTPSRMYQDILYVYDNKQKYLGYLSGVVRVYDIGRVLVNNTNQFAYNVVTRVEVFPQSDVKVKKYKTRIHCNIVGHTMLESVSLPSGINRTQSVSLEGGFSKGDGGSGSVNYNTSWSYNPESQKITKSSSHPRIVDWEAETVSAKAGKSFDLTPGMTISSTGSTGQRGAFSTMYCDALTFFDTVLHSNSLEIGGWF